MVYMYNYKNRHSSTYHCPEFWYGYYVFTYPLQCMSMYNNVYLLHITKVTTSTKVIASWLLAVQQIETISCF